MSEQDKSGQARKGLIDSVKGKAKEVVGAMTGNDSLTAEGQLEQTQARGTQGSQQRRSRRRRRGGAGPCRSVRSPGGGRSTASRGERQGKGRGEQRAQTTKQRKSAQQSTLRRATPSGPRRGPNSTHSSRCNRRRTLSAKRSTPRPRRPSTPPQNIRARCRLPTVPRQRPTASDARPTA